MGAGGQTLSMPVPSTKKSGGGIDKFTPFSNKLYPKAHCTPISLAIHMQRNDKDQEKNI